jgi:hypothetical protein
MADRADHAPEESLEQPGPDTRDPLLSLRGSGRTLWANEHGDAYVTRLREGWT